MRFQMNITDKKTLVKRVGELTGEQPRYTFMPRCAYEIGAYTVEKNGDLVVEDTSADDAIIQTLLEEGLIAAPSQEEAEEEEMEVETVNETAESEETAEEEPEATSETADAPEEAAETGATGGEAAGLTISLPMTNHTADSLHRLINLIYSRGPLISKATGGAFSVTKELVDFLDTAGVIVGTANFINKVRECGGVEGVTFEEDKISFTGFPMSYDNCKVKALQELCCLINKHVLEQKRIQAKIVNDENEKYAFRIWLLRIGMKGDDYKESRRVLMENLSGHTAFRTKVEEEKWKARQAEKREELRAANAAQKAAETAEEAV